MNLPIGRGAVALRWRLHRSTTERLARRVDAGGLILFTVFVATTLAPLEQIQRADLGAFPQGGVGQLTIGVVSFALLIRK